MSKVVISFFAFFAVFLVLSEATRIDKCQAGQTGSLKDVEISDCKAPPCKLLKGKRVSLTEVFIPDRDVKTLTTSIKAIILGVPLPFFGVDGTSACNDLYQEDGITKASCPLKKGTPYVYKKEFPVERFYPSIPGFTIEWGLAAENNIFVTCFKVRASIRG